jgi:hypothetical protein
MGRVRLYTGATGRLQFDSARPDADIDETDSGIAADYEAGVILRVDPDASLARCYYQARRGTGPEQMIAEYRGSATGSGRDRNRDPLTELEFGLQAALDELGWTVVEDAGGNQAVFDNLGRVSPVEPALVSAEQLRELLADGEQLSFGAPDPVAALGFVEYVRSGPLSDLGLSVAICNNGRVDRLSDVDVVVNPLVQVDDVRPVGDTHETVRARRARGAAGRLDEAVRDAGETLQRDPARSSAAAVELAGALNEAVLDGLDVRAVSRDDVTGDRRRHLLAGAVGAVVCVALVTALAIVTLEPPLPVENATRGAGIYLPGRSTPLVVVPSWQLLVGGGVVLSVAAGPSVIAGLDRLPTPDVARPDVGTVSASTPAIRRADEALSDLDDEVTALASHRPEDDRTLLRQAVERTLDGTGIDLEADKARQRAKLRTLAIGGGIGGAAGAVVGAVGVAAYWLATTHWLQFVEVVVVAAPVALAAQAGYQLRRAVGGALLDAVSRTVAGDGPSEPPPLGGTGEGDGRTRRARTLLLTGVGVGVLVLLAIVAYLVLFGPPTLPVPVPVPDPLQDAIPGG